MDKSKAKAWVRDVTIAAAGLLAAMIAFVLLVALTLEVTGASAETMWVNVGEHSHLNGRSRAVNGEITAKLQRGWEVEVVHIRNGWALIDGYSEDGCCWVSAEYLSRTPLPRVEAFTPVQAATKVGKLLVRICPAGRVVDRIERKGTELTVYATVAHGGETWAYIDDGRWVMWRFLEVDGR